MSHLPYPRVSCVCAHLAHLTASYSPFALGHALPPYTLPPCARCVPHMHLMHLQPRLGTSCDGSGSPFAPATLTGIQAYKNGLQGLSATYLGIVRFTDVTMWDNGGGPRTLTSYMGDTGGNVSGVFKLSGGNVEFGKVGRVCV